MKRLGRIFRNKLVLYVLGFLLLVVLFFVFKPLNWFKSFLGYGNLSKVDSIASRLFDAMNRFGTDESTIFLLLDPLSSSDLKRVYESFGNRPYANGGRLVVLGASMDLFGWFGKELTEKEKARMRDIWAKTDLEITF